jgi:hypothetical protein
VTICQLQAQILAPPVDVKALIDNMGDQVPLQGMAAVGH